MIVVLDACVLYPAYLRDTLLCAAEADLYDPRWSDDILAEMERNLVADVLTLEQVRHLVSAMRAAFPEALVRDYAALIPLIRNDPKDRHVVAAAVRSADAFLTLLYHINADSMIEIVREQAASYRRPPRTMSDVLDLGRATRKPCGS